MSMRVLQRGLKLMDALSRPGGARALATWRPFSISIFQMFRALEGAGVAPRTILDGGANIGTFSRGAVKTFPDARVLAFEPLPDVAAALRDAFRDSPQVEVIETALGNDDGTVEFFPDRWDQSSSALAALPQMQESFPQTGQLDPIQVPLAKLDTLLADRQLESPVLVKLDLQGFELEALKGAAQVLDRFDHILLEMGLVPLYEGQPDFHEIYSWLQDHGFPMVAPLSRGVDGDGRVVEMDVLFARR